MKSLLASLLAFLTVVLVGCDDGYQREPVASYTFEGVRPTAVGETAHVRLVGWVAEDDHASPYDYSITSVTCLLEGCTASIARGFRPNEIDVDAAFAGEAKVSVVVDANPPRTLEVTVPFRKATKISIVRDVMYSPAGSAYAMVPGDWAVWYIAPADDQGILAGNPYKIRVAEDSEAVFCHPDDRTEEARFYGATALACLIQTKSAETIPLVASYGPLERHERIVVASLSSAREGSLLLCRGTENDPRPIELENLPCEPVTTLRYPGRYCPERQTLMIVPRLVLDDGKVALGGAKFLAIDGEYIGAQSTGTIEGRLEGRGTIVGRIGSASISVPFEVGPDCPRP